MATYKELSAADVKTSKSVLNQLIDIVQADISSSNTRQKYQVFVTGGIGPGVTSSLHQTIYDQDFTLQTANPLFDMTVGLYVSGASVTGSQTGEDVNGKLLFPSNSLMMREKINIYRQFAQLLKGDSGEKFFSPPNNTDSDNRIDDALFIAYKRLFARDKIKRETFAMRFYTSASATDIGEDGSLSKQTGRDNLARGTISGSMIITDLGSATNQTQVSFGGEVGALVDANDTNNKVGLVYYDQGIAVLNLKRVLSGSQRVSGTIDSMQAAASINGYSVPAGKTIIGARKAAAGPAQSDRTATAYGNPNATFIPDFVVSASIDNIINHVAEVRFQSGSALTAMTFQNQTNINSTLIFCRASADEFNYSANPTFTNSSDDRLVVIEPTEETTQRTFTFPTAIGLYDANDNLLAVSKLSRPVEKNDEKDITFRVRLDF